jgi:5-methyltetrahydropteroyltriglutamate--homocysteine methyltransferase
MKLSTDRVLTTHVGSLPRPGEVVELLFAQDRGESYDASRFEDVLQQAVDQVVDRQGTAGVDIVSDGEMSKISYATYIRHRLTGFEVGDVPRATPADLDDFPEYRDRIASIGATPKYLRPICKGPIGVRDQGPLQRDIARFKRALSASSQAGVSEAFMNAVSPGTIAMFQPNE